MWERGRGGKRRDVWELCVGGGWGKRREVGEFYACGGRWGERIKVLHVILFRGGGSNI